MTVDDKLRGRRASGRGLIVALAVALAVVGVLVILAALSPSPTRHDTNRWAVIQDLYGSRLAVEPTNDTVWARLVGMHGDGSRLWVGGVVERYANGWGFRFRPDTVRVAEITAEGLQSTIRGISEDLDYWLGLGWAYVNAGVVEVHGS
jgi:hypothetical protein